MKKNINGFTLFEVLVAMFITGLALLALAIMDVYILKSSHSSFNYTVATIRANSFVDSVWNDLCNAQKSTSDSTYITIRSDWVNTLSAANMTTVTASPPATYPTSHIALVTVNWSDLRFIDDAANNAVTMDAQFPDSGCG